MMVLISLTSHAQTHLVILQTLISFFVPLVRFTEIERENRILLEKMSNIM